MEPLRTDGHTVSLLARQCYYYKFDTHYVFNARSFPELVLRSMEVHIGILAKLVAETGAITTSFETLFAKQEYHSKTMIDIGVLCSPEADHPYFKVRSHLSCSVSVPSMADS